MVKLPEIVKPGDDQSVPPEGAWVPRWVPKRPKPPLHPGRKVPFDEWPEILPPGLGGIFVPDPKKPPRKPE